MARIIQVNAVIDPLVARLSINEQLDVLAVCEARDPDLAEDHIVKHLSNAMDRNLGV